MTATCSDSLYMATAGGNEATCSCLDEDDGDPIRHLEKSLQGTPVPAFTILSLVVVSKVLNRGSIRSMM